PRMGEGCRGGRERAGPAGTDPAGAVPSDPTRRSGAWARAGGAARDTGHAVDAAAESSRAGTRAGARTRSAARSRAGTEARVGPPDRADATAARSTRSPDFPEAGRAAPQPGRERLDLLPARYSRASRTSSS